MNCRLGGECELVSRDYLLVSEIESMPATIGVAQCLKCSQVYEAIGWKPRICDYCDLPYKDSLHDPCLGTIEGVIRACCGHGDPSRRYFVMSDGTLVQ